MTRDEFIDLVPSPSHDDISTLSHKLWKQGGEQPNAGDYYWHRAEVILWIAYIHRMDKALANNREGIKWA